VNKHSLILETGRKCRQNFGEKHAKSLSVLPACKMMAVV